jgi:hypothetical protein
MSRRRVAFLLASVIFLLAVAPATGKVDVLRIARRALRVAERADQAARHDKVTSARLADGGVGAADLADGAVTQAKLRDDAVTAGKLAAGAVTLGKLAGGSVSGAALQDGVITAGKVADQPSAAARWPTGR